MKILLDENLDWRLARDLHGHEVKSVPRIGWAGLKNGKLLEHAQREFDVLLTMDYGMASEQNIAQFNIAVVAFRAPSNRLGDTRPLIPKVLALLPSLQKGQLVTVSA